MPVSTPPLTGHPSSHGALQSLALADAPLRRALDASDNAIDATQVRSITVIYQWRFFDGSNSAGRWHLNSVRNIRSAAPNF